MLGAEAARPHVMTHPSWQHASGVTSRNHTPPVRLQGLTNLTLNPYTTTKVPATLSHLLSQPVHPFLSLCLTADTLSHITSFAIEAFSLKATRDKQITYGSAQGMHLWVRTFTGMSCANRQAWRRKAFRPSVILLKGKLNNKKIKIFYNWHFICPLARKLK